MLDEEAGPADELVGLFREDPVGYLRPVVGLGELLVFFVGFFDDETFFQDLVQAGLYVLVVSLVFFFVGFFCGRGCCSRSNDRNRCDHVVVLFDLDLHNVIEILYIEVRAHVDVFKIAVEVVVFEQLVCRLLELDLVEVLGIHYVV